MGIRIADQGVGPADAFDWVAPGGEVKSVGGDISEKCLSLGGGGCE